MDEDSPANSQSAAQTGPNNGDIRRVVGWLAYASVEVRDCVDVGSWGGWVSKGDTWNDYITSIVEKWVPHYEALRAEIQRIGLRRGADWHQSAPDGVPVFDDGALATFSFRGWGDLMAATWADTDGRRYGYMDFYMDSCVEDAGIKLSPPIDRPGSSVTS
jgi:hypothetical protein